MENEISSLCEGLRLTDEERQEVVVRKEEVLLSVAKSKKCLVAHIAAEKEVNKGTFISTMSKIWPTGADNV